MKQFQRKIDELGRVIIPEEIRQQLGIKAKNRVGIMLVRSEIVIVSNLMVCNICGRPVETGEKSNLCNECIRKVIDGVGEIQANTRPMIERCVDEFGRIVLPIEFRRALHIEKNSGVILTVENEKIIIKPCVYICANCGAVIDSSKKYRLCDACVQVIRHNSRGETPSVFYKEGRLIIDPISFILPDRTYISTVTEFEIKNGIAIMSEDERVVVIVMENEVAESAKESIDSIFDSEFGYKKIGEIEPIVIEGYNGYSVRYENEKTVNYECCIDVANDLGESTITIWARTDRRFGESAVEDMKDLFEEIISGIQLEV